jgi:hypothetical protein
MRREKTKISKIRNPKETITTNTMEIQGKTDYFGPIF